MLKFCKHHSSQLFYLNLFNISKLRYCKQSSFSKIVDVGTVSERLMVPPHIPRPTRVFKMSLFKKTQIDIKTEDDIIKMRESCTLANKILTLSKNFVKVGVTTDEIDKKVHELIIDHNAYPSPLLYKGFPKSICTSVNNVVIHGIPDDRKLENGDIITIDISVFLNEFHGDCAATFEVGEVDEAGKGLIEATRKCRDEAIKICAPDVNFFQIGKTIDALAKSLGYTVAREVCGHGIGQYFHGPPDILHFHNSFPHKMKEGMTFTIEPALTEGSDDGLSFLKDGWTAVTINECRAAQFEHTILITKDGAEILTQ